MIRFAATDDAKQIAELHIESQRRTYVGIYTSQYLNALDVFQYEMEWKEYLNRRDIKTIVYESEKHIIGFAAIHFYFDQYFCTSLDYLHVSKEYQGKGIGTFLLKEIFAIMVSEKIDKLMLYCTEGNDKAKRFYQKFGAQYKGSKLVDGVSGLYYINRLLIDGIKEKDSKEFYSELGYSSEYKTMLDYIKKEYILWGAGDYYNKFCGQFGDSHKPICIFDNNSRLWGLTVNDVPIVKPYKTDIPIIIACARYNEVEADINKLGCKKKVAFYPWHDYLSDLTDI